MMPYILKNNLLEGCTLSRILWVQEINKIWVRLKSVYGNRKSLLKKKIAETSRISQLWKLKDPHKLVESLSRIINTMKNLQRLALEHGIESRLYCGNSIERIYKFLLAAIK